MGKKLHFRPGDVLDNGWAGEVNPQKYTMYLGSGSVSQGRYRHKVFKCIGFDGEIVDHLQSDHRLEVVGHMDEFDVFRAALKRLKEMNGKLALGKAPCRMCLNARVDPELSEENDLSFHGIGDCAKDWRLMLRSGGGRPTEILAEAWLGNQWGIIGSYAPKFCPECGRRLSEYEEGLDYG